MKNTIKTLAIRLGKEIRDALISALAMFIGKLVIGGFTKGFNKFQSSRLTKKQQAEAKADVEETEHTESESDEQVEETERIDED